MDRTPMKQESIDCTDMKALLSAYLDDEMDGPTRHLAERHLVECAGCRAIVNEAEGLDELIALDAEARERTVRLSDEFHEKVLARTAYARSPQTRNDAAAGYRWAMWTGWLAAAACLGLAGVIWVESNTPTRESVAQDERQSQSRAERQEPRDQRSPIIQPAAYTTGLDLQSETFEGTLPAEAFRLAPGLPSAFTPGFGPGMHPGSSAALPLPQPELPHAPEAQLDDRDDVSELDVEESRVGIEQQIRAVQPRELLAPALAREDAETLHSVALLLDLLEGVDVTSFAEVEWMRQVIEADALLERVFETRDRIGVEDRPVVFAAEAILVRIANGPLDQKDVERLRETALALDLAGRINRISRRGTDVSPL